MQAPGATWTKTHLLITRGELFTMKNIHYNIYVSSKGVIHKTAKNYQGQFL